MVRCAKLWKIQEARLLGTCTAHLHSGFSHLHGYLGLHGYSELIGKEGEETGAVGVL